MFLSRNKKNNVYPCKPQFYYIKVGFKGVEIIYTCFRDAIFVILIIEAMPINIHEIQIPGLKIAKLIFCTPILSGPMIDYFLRVDLL